MAQFRIELDRPMPHGTTVGMLSLLRGFISSLPDVGHGPPNAYAAQGLNWADHLCRRGFKLANMAFTIPASAYAASATMALLLKCAHARVESTMLSFPVIDANGDRFLAIITSMDVERWLEDKLLAERTKQLRQMQKQLARESRGRVRITIIYPPGRPLLSQQEAAHMISTQLGPNTGPRPEDLKDTHGLKVEGVSNLRWASNVDPMDQWPIRLQHPTLGDHMYYMYLIESAYSHKEGLCAGCHQKGCKAKSGWACKHYRDSLRNPRRSGQHNRPIRGYTTAQHAFAMDPMVQMQNHS